MDLDSLKKSWQQADIKPTIDELKIQKMLDNKGKSAYANLLKYDKLFLWLLIPCALADILFFWMHYIPGIVYLVMLIYSFFWQRYKLRFLRSINLSDMGMLEVSKRITKYKKILLYEIMIGIMAIAIFFIIYLYFGIPSMLEKIGASPGRIHSFSDSSHVAIWFIVMVVSTLFLTLILYRVLYFKNIKQIQESVEEIKEFEKD